MEDVDNIIIDSLKNLKCSIDDDITSLKQFNNDLIIKAIVLCIDLITPGTGFPSYLPQSMSQRLKLGTNIAEQIKELGFPGDIGYQTILYCNEVEARRLLMFLIERVPREPDKQIHSEDSSYISTTIKTMKLKLRQGLKSVWVPNVVLRNGMRHTKECDIRVGYGHGFPLRTTYLNIPNSGMEQTEALKQYNVRFLPNVTKQCSYKSLIPSLLFNNTVNFDEQYVTNILKQSEIIQDWSEVNMLIPNEATNNQTAVQDESVVVQSNLASVSETKQDSINEIEKLKESISIFHSELKTLEENRSKLLDKKTENEKELSKSLQQLKIKSKSHSLMTDKDNYKKLQSVIDNDEERLVELSNQWKSIQKPLLQRHKELLQTVNLNECEAQNMQNRLHNAKQKCKRAYIELKEKEQLHSQLAEQCAKLSKQTNRSAYTRRILEIISNIKKQNNDINKILVDTKEIQKEINTLSGQLERSFALSDEIIFRDAKQDETARKAYKLLATMHTEYEEVGRAATELGSIIRESRNLQEQVDNEETREIAVRLERVIADLNQIKSETAILMNQKQLKEIKNT